MSAGEARTYAVCVDGHLDDRWSTWFGELTIDRYDDGTCTLTGEVADQAQLHGVLSRLRDLGATLLWLSVVDLHDEVGSAPRALAVSGRRGARARDHGVPRPAGC